MENEINMYTVRRNWLGGSAWCSLSATLARLVCEVDKEVDWGSGFGLGLGIAFASLEVYIERDVIYTFTR